VVSRLHDEGGVGVRDRDAVGRSHPVAGAVDASDPVTDHARHGTHLVRPGAGAQLPPGAQIPGVRRGREALEEALERGARPGRPAHHAARSVAIVVGTGSVSFTSAMETDGISRMKPRKSRKKKPKLPMVSVVSTMAGT
jgi:hypothetical protein